MLKKKVLRNMMVHYYKFIFFQTYILEELFSPIITPIWLLFRLRPKSLELVDFFRHNTVDVAGVGDVCSFAQMDIKKHGHPQVCTFQIYN